MLQDLVPGTLEETIITYLKGQEAFGEDQFDYNVGHILAEKEVKYILEELLFKVCKKIACRDRYDNLKEWHHQHPLFDMDQFVPNFCIDDEMFRKLAFRETLLISEVDYPSKDLEVEPRAMGGLCLDIQMVNACQPVKREARIDTNLDREVFQILQRIKGATELSLLLESDELEGRIQAKLREYEEILKNEMRDNVKKFVLHLSSQFRVGDCNAGSTITSWVDRQLHTLEEKRTEYIKEPDGINEKTVYAAIQNNKYYTHHTSTLENLDVKKYYRFTAVKNVLLEGASFLLMRYLAITQYVGTFEMATMYINGDLCRNIYECVGPKPGVVNGKNVTVCKIYRCIIEECGIEHVAVAVLTTYGHIVMIEWEGCNYIVNMNPLQYVDKEQPPPYNRMVLRETWKDDLQLMSRYMDRKTAAEREMKTYMSQHPELKEMMADYVQNLLLLKPENIMDFTKDHFRNLYPFDMPQFSYFEDHRKNVMEDVQF